ncbi:MAG: hypothetical protein HUU57_05510 [Bdellovibrio sp.]|nr:hypothetical protein [Bdellovibrio sp.]
MTGIAIPLESRVRYLKRRQAEINDLMDSEAAPEVLLEKAQKIGHQVKGNAFTFDFADLTDNAKSLEAAALKKDIIEVLTFARALMAQVEAHLSTLV